MHISKIRIENFRNFHSSEVQFNKGINVIIGHNNSGKSNLIRALSLLLDSRISKRLDCDDFYKRITLAELKEKSPRIEIELTISQDSPDDNDPDDLSAVANWLVSLEVPYEARLTFQFYLPEEHSAVYLETVGSIGNESEIWNVIERDFLRLYVHKTYCGPVENQTLVDAESIQKFDFQFLDAIRDVERDMLSGRNSLLRDVLHFFLDYDVKSDLLTDDAAKRAKIGTRAADFGAKSLGLLEDLKARMQSGKDRILSYATQTGASFNNSVPDFEGFISEVDLYSALRLIVKNETGIEMKIPASHNGLGYNNLIYISLLLAKMQVNADGTYLGVNAKVFPVLAIEEPEAHLHPAMQYKFLKFLRENKGINQVRQIFVTTHSTHITSAVLLDEIICLHVGDENLTVGYPGRTFPDTDKGREAKAYVERFLDATRSDMLFAKTVVFVEGMAEQLLLSVLAKNHEHKIELEDHHVAVINVGGRYFNHFLHIFDKNSSHTIPKKIACVTDRDPTRKEGDSDKFRSCYPFETDQDGDCEYKSHAKELLETYDTHPNIRFFSQDERIGKTFEYDFVLCNPTLELLVTESTSNRDEILALMRSSAASTFEELTLLLRESKENVRIIKSLKATPATWTSDEKKCSLIAARYLNSVSKGINALELSKALAANLYADEPQPFRVPTYICDCLDWIVPNA